VLFRLGADEQKSRLRLLLYARDEIGRALYVERHDDGSAQRTAEERDDPFGAVRRPQKHALTSCDAARFKLARELEGRARDARISPTHGSKPAEMREGRLVAALEIVVKIAVD
jgi:hypothetical protein